MPDSIPAPDAETLLEHADWLRRLARRLVLDSQAAEDLSQETWLRALKHPPQRGGPLRAWLGTVMRNALRQRRRGERQPMHTEALAEQLAQAPSPETEGLALLAKVELQRDLVTRVLQLREPYRSTLILRYFEDLSPARIASRRREPIASVKTRLARGMQQLRDSLQHEHGASERSWLLALLPLMAPNIGAPVASPFAKLALWISLMKTKPILVLLVLVVLGTSYLATRSKTPSSLGAGPGLPQAKASKALAAETRSTQGDQAASNAATDAQAQRAALPARPAQELPNGPQSPAASQVFHGRAVDLDGAPLAGVRVRPEASTGSDAGSLAWITGADGSFETDRRERQLVLDDARYCTILSGTTVAASSRTEVIVVAANRLLFAGRVQDEFGAPLEGAKLELLLPIELRSKIGLVLDHSTKMRFASSSLEGGAFAFDTFPRVPGAQLKVVLEGFEPYLSEASLLDDGQYLVSMRRPAASDSMLRGIVLDDQGAPVFEAAVSLGVACESSAADGSFAFDLRDPDSINARLSSMMSLDTSRLRAVKAGYAMAEWVAEERTQAGQPKWPAEVILRLGRETLAMRGIVLDQAGDPLPGVGVWVADPTFFGSLALDGDRSEPRFTHVETVQAGGDRTWHSVLSGPDGRFLIEGLLDREYRIEAMLPETLQRVVARAVPAGSDDLMLSFSSAGIYPTLRGRVLDRNGKAMANVSLGTSCDAFRVEIQGRTLSTSHGSGSSTSTDSRGHFELENVPRNFAYLRLDHPEGVPLEWGRNLEGGLQSLVGEASDELLIVMGRRCRFQVQLFDPKSADALRVLDQAGEPLELSEFLGRGRRSGTEMRILDGSTSFLGVSDAARVLVLLFDGKEVSRREISLDPGKEVVLRQ